MLLLVFSTNTIYAHSVLLDANPEEGEVVVDHLSTNSLPFSLLMVLKTAITASISPLSSPFIA